MDLYEALLGRRTVFHYTADPVPDDVMNRAFEAARWAPNHKLTEPWGFVLVGPETRARLGEVARRLAKKKAEGAPADQAAAIVAKQVAKVTSLPRLVVVTNRRSPDDDFREREDYAATTCAIHNLVLSLWADGVGAQWSTGGLTRDAESYEILEIDAEREEIVGFLKIGFSAKVPDSKRQRGLGDIVRRVS